jgi:Mrp family chromosome partitioning ATPase
VSELACPDPLQLREDGVRLAARLRAAFTESENVVLFAGAYGGDGVSIVATQVSVAVAHMNEGRVLLVDLNLRRRQRTRRSRWSGSRGCRSCS